MPTPTVSLVPPEAETAVDDVICAEHRAVIDLFASQLAKVAFPDVDAALLRRQADEVRAATVAVARARDALEAAQRALVERTAVLGDTVTRGLAYARIYAAAQPDRSALAAAIDALVTPATPPTNGPVKRRGRPPRQSAELFASTADEPTT